MDFRSTRDFSAKKGDNSTNFAAGGIINSGTHHIALFGDKNKAMSHVTLPHLRELSPAPTLLG
jgi:hypothetical protein